MEEEIIIIESEEEQEIITIEEDIEYIEPTTQEKTVIPTEEQQIVVPDDGVFALSKVNVEPIPSEYIKPTGTLDITANGEYDVKSYERAKVKVGEVEKGLVINEYDEDGFPTDVSIVGMTELPNSYLFYAGYKNSTLAQCFLSRVGANMHFPKDLISIGNSAFSYWNTLKITELPDTIVSIGDDAFYSNGELPLNKFPEKLQTIGKQAFWGCKKMNSDKLPSGLTSIGQSTFRDCVLFTNLDVLSTVLKTIGNYAFRGCSGLIKIIFRATTPPTLGSSAFQSTPIESKTGYIYVPDESLELYKKATNWSTYADQIKGLSELEG